MKRNELKENEPIKVPYGSFKGGYELNDGTFRKVNESRYYMTIYTDGTILSKGEPIQASKEDLELLIKEYNTDMNYLETTDLVLKDYSYVVTFTTVRKWAKVGHIYGWFSFLVGTNIYMKNPKDRKSLKVIKKLLLDIDENNRSVNYSSVWSYTFGKRIGLQHFESTEILDNVYSLKRI